MFIETFKMYYTMMGFRTFKYLNTVESETKHYLYTSIFSHLNNYLTKIIAKNIKLFKTIKYYFCKEQFDKTIHFILARLKFENWLQL